MTELFLVLFRFFKKRKFLFWLSFLGSFLLLSIVAFQVKLEEDITKIFPADERVEKFNYIFKNSTFADRVVVMVSLKSRVNTAQPDTLVAVAERLSSDLAAKLTPYQATVTAQIDQEKFTNIFQTAYEYLPVFFTEGDYKLLDSISSPEVSREVLERSYRQLVSPTGLALKKMLIKDPMGFSFIVLKKLEQLQYDENLTIYDNFILTKDHRHLIFFITPATTSGETGKSAPFVAALEDIIEVSNSKLTNVEVSAFGSALVAVGNAKQIKKDTILTISLLVVLLGTFIFTFFRKKRVLLLILIPVLYGSVFALCCIYFYQGSASILALAAGSVILGVAVNYALHLLVHLRHHPDKEETIRDLVRPMMLGSTTTVLAFFSLQFTNAGVLKDLGLFAGFSLIGAALSSLIFLPHLASVEPVAYKHIENFSPFLTKIRNKGVWVIFLVTPVFFYFADNVKFNSDMRALNFMTDKTREAEKRLESINPASLRTLYVSSTGNAIQRALKLNESVSNQLDSLKTAGLINRYRSVSSLLISDSLQQVRIERWNRFWTSQRKTTFLNTVQETGKRLKFSDAVINSVHSLVNRKYTPLTDSAFDDLRNTFFADQILEKNGDFTIITLVNTIPGNAEKIQALLEGPGTVAFDRRMITNMFVQFVKEDFTYIVTSTSILVFLVLLISYGRLELTLITFMPMLITWIWILGIMALVGIEFNIVNVMVSTFIFGLGDDYSIFVMDGLQQEYKTGKSVLSSVRISIFLSALTTISGLGVLIFAEHPALRSIAAIAIIGIACVFIMSQTIEPYLFRWLVSNRIKKGLPPMDILGLILTVLTYGLFVFGSFFLTLIGLLLKLIPIKRKGIQLAYHHLIRFFTGVVLFLNFKLKQRIINHTSDTFSTPSVIIANHNSFLDILITTMLHPKVVLLTNKWVWNSPVFGGVVRLADYYPVMDGADDSVIRLKRKVADGYSIVVFPEGTRSEDGRIGRFHKGAFYLAEKLDLPITPLVIHGAHEGIPKHSFYVNDSTLTIKFLPRIARNDSRFGTSYTERCKTISRYFKNEYAKIDGDPTLSGAFVSRLKSNYAYKGPVLEWYLKIKIRLEQNYQFFNSIVPRQGSILDLGCGYGFLAYALQLLSDERVIHGVDYDEEKISVAQHGYLRTSRLTFECADVSVYTKLRYDVIIMSDVLHYLMPDDQVNLLKRCFEQLNPGGQIIIRDGNSDMAQRHKGTLLTEFFSVKLLKFNKSVNPLNFVSGKQIAKLAAEHGFAVEDHDHTTLTSNIIFVIKKAVSHGKI